jgi:hypothetical protein
MLLPANSPSTRAEDSSSLSGASSTETCISARGGAPQPRRQDPPPPYIFFECLLFSQVLGPFCSPQCLTSRGLRCFAGPWWAVLLSTWQVTPPPLYATIRVLEYSSTVLPCLLPRYPVYIVPTNISSGVQAPCTPTLAHTSSLGTDRTRNAHAPTSPRIIGFCAIWGCIAVVRFRVRRLRPCLLWCRYRGLAPCQGSAITRSISICSTVFEQMLAQ